jgi:hypothetical protein
LNLAEFESLHQKTSLFAFSFHSVIAMWNFSISPEFEKNCAQDFQTSSNELSHFIRILNFQYFSISEPSVFRVFTTNVLKWKSFPYAQFFITEHCEKINFPLLNDKFSQFSSTHMSFLTEKRKFYCMIEIFGNNHLLIKCSSCS